MKILLVRHARADGTRNEDRPLSQESFQAAQRLAQELSDQPIEAVYASPYQRAFQTVQPLAQRLGLAVKIEAGFRERALGQFSGISFDEAVRQTWADFNFAHPGGETNTAAQARAIRALEALLASETASQVVIGTHGNLLALILNYYDPSIGFDFWSRLAMPDVVEIEVSP